jgi:hypothetical protein
MYINEIIWKPGQFCSHGDSLLSRPADITSTSSAKQKASPPCPSRGGRVGDNSWTGAHVECSCLGGGQEWRCGVAAGSWGSGVTGTFPEVCLALSADGRVS